MLNFNDMPEHARAWIYQSNRVLEPQEIAEIKRRAAVFLLDWTSHGSWMKACIDVLYDRFVVVLVDETVASASGCGIDKSVHFIQQLEKEMNLVLFDRLLVVYRDANKEIRTARLPEFEQLAASGKIGPDTIVFNNLVATKEEMETKWQIPMKKSWHARMLVA